MTRSVFRMTVPELERQQRGQGITADRLNQPVDALIELTRGVGAPRMYQPEGAGGGEIAAGARAMSFRIHDVGSDWIRCRTWDGMVEGENDVYVAKPWELQRTPFDGYEWEGVLYTYETNTRRLASLVEEQQYEVIVPAYTLGGILHAIPAQTFVVDPFAETVRLLEVSPARMWMREYGEW